MQRGIHDIHQPFAFRSHPEFIFHDSPGFETGDEKQLQEVLSFMEMKAKSTIRCMLFGRFLYLNVHTSHWWAVRGGRFCVVLNNARPLLPLETEFFETARAGKGFYRPIAKVPKLTFYSARHPYLYQVRWSDDSDIWHWWRWRCQLPKCGGTGGKEVQITIVRICLSTTCRCLLWRQVPVNLLPSVM